MGKKPAGTGLYGPLGEPVGRKASVTDPNPGTSLMYYAELPARPELRPWIAAYWHFRVAVDAGEIEHTVPLTGGVLVHHSSRDPDLLLVTGPRTAPLRTTVRGGDEFWGVHLWPGAASSLLGVEAGSLREGVVPLEELFDRTWCRRLAARLTEIPSRGDAEAAERIAAERTATERLDRAWSERAESAGPLDRPVMRAVFLLLRSRGEEPVTRLAEAVGLSPRHFRRRFRAAVGLTPKELARLRRVRSSAAGLVFAGETWVELAADHGYADQAHLVREYRSLLGVTPTDFRRHARRIEHGRILS